MAIQKITTAAAGFEQETSSLKLPVGTTAQRPASPTIGMVRYNTDNACLEQYTSAGWTSISSPPSISSVSPTAFNGEQGTSFTINGQSFDAAATVKFVTSGGVEVNAATVSYVNNTQLTATTSRDFTVAEEPLKVKVINSTGLSYTLDNAIDCGGSPTWSSPTAGDLYSGISIYESELAIGTKTFSATDPDAGATIAYSVASGLPSGSINSSSGVWTPGTFPTVASDTTYNFTVVATDNAGNTANRAFSTAVKDDASLNYTSNLRIWLRGGYNGASAGSISSGASVPIPYLGSGAGNATTFGSVSRTANNTNTGSPINTSGSKYIKDAAGGATAVLQDDKLVFDFTTSNTGLWATIGAGNSILDSSTTNHTYSYWLNIYDVAANTGANNLITTFHSWSNSSANSVNFIAHDWYTNATSNIYLVYYANAANLGTFTPTLSGGTNGNKNVWFHVAIVHTSSTITTYINGSVQSNSLTAVNTWPTPGSAQLINFGGRADGTSGGLPGNYTNGSFPKGMADIRYYNTNLSAAAIAAIYNKSRTSFA
jgi:hypothetical protein